MQTILEIFIKRPVLSLSVSLAILILGLVGYFRLPVREFPLVGDTFISVTTAYPGATPKACEDFVSTPITAAISGIDGIDYIASENGTGKSRVTIKLIEGYDPDRALTEINTRVTGVLWRLPEGVLSPVVEKNLTSTPCLFFTFKSTTLSPERISDYLDRMVVPQLESLSGVRGMLYHGHRTLAMRLWLDPDRMAALDVTALEVKKALKADNLRSTAGRLKGGLEEYNLTLDSELKTPEQFGEIVIKSQGDYLVRLKDVGRAELGARHYRVSIFENKENAIILGVVPHDRADNVKTAEDIQALAPQIQAQLPPNLSMEMIWIPAHISKDAVDSVFYSAWLAVVCVLIVIFLFLGSFRSILIPSVTIPFSLIGVCALLDLLGGSINTLTLLGAVLTIGLVVDDAIVVVENVHRHLDLGAGPGEAALAGTKEIAVPVIAMTLTVAVVFLPIGLLPGLTGALFHQFAWVVAGTVLLSGFFALTLSPMMCATLLKPVSRDSFSGRVEALWTRASNRYGAWLDKVLGYRFFVLVLVALLFAGGWVLFNKTPSELMPDEDQGVVLGIGIGPTSSSLDYMEKYGKQIGEIYAKVKEKAGYAVICGWKERVNHITSFMLLRDPPQKGDRTEEEIMREIQPQFAKITGIRAFVINRPPLLDIMGVSAPVNFVLKSSGSEEDLDRAMQILMERARAHHGFVGVQTDLKVDKPGVFVTIDRDKAYAMGVSVQDIALTLNMLMGQPIIGWFSYKGWGYPVVPQLEEVFRENPEKFQHLKVRAKNGRLVPLSSLVDFEIQAEPQTRNQFQRMKSATLSSHLAHGFTLGEALEFLDGVVEKELPKSIIPDYSGASREFVRSGHRMAILFVFCLGAIYLMLAAQFNSFTDPLVIMVSVPLSVFGALVAMKIVGATLNIYTEIGLVMLIGLISKHGILIVNFANASVADGKSPREAVIHAARVRLRPVLMTTCAMVFGAFPLVLARGGGHESLNQIGAVIIGGLSFGTLLTLFVVPVFFTFVCRRSSS